MALQLATGQDGREHLMMDGWIMFFGPKVQRWDQQGHSAPKKRKKKWDKSKKKHPTKFVKAASCCLLSPLTTTTGWILRGHLMMGFPLHPYYRHPCYGMNLDHPIPHPWCMFDPSTQFSAAPEPLGITSDDCLIPSRSISIWLKAAMTLTDTHTPCAVAVELLQNGLSWPVPSLWWPANTRVCFMKLWSELQLI